MTSKIEAYETSGAIYPDMPLNEQIDAGVNDWRAEGGGIDAVGRTRQEALDNLRDTLDQIGG